jgi:DNA-binding SARP family transcriptional activator
LRLKVFLTGRVSVESDDAVIDEARFPGRQGRLLFAYLVAEDGRPVPRDELAEALWGERLPATWDKALAVLVSKLRSLLSEQGIDGTHVLTGAFGCYRLELPEGSWVDVTVAANAAQEVEEALATDGVERAKAAASLVVSLTRGPFLPGEEGSWVEQKRRELTDVRMRALSALAEACLRVTALIGELVGAELNGHTNGATAVDVEGAGSRTTSGLSTKVCRTCVRARRERERRTAATSAPAAQLLRTVIA